MLRRETASSTDGETHCQFRPLFEIAPDVLLHHFVWDHCAEPLLHRQGVFLQPRREVTRFWQVKKTTDD